MRPSNLTLMPKFFIMLLLIGSLLMPALSALAAAEPAEAAAEVDFRGYYLEPGAPADIDELEALVDEFSDFGFVALAADPAGGADRFADEVRQASAARTVIVVSPGELGYVSDDFDGDQLDQAADAAIGLFDRSYADGFRRFAAELAGVPAVATTSAGPALTTPALQPQAGAAEETSGGGGGLLVLLVIVVAVIGFFVWRSRRAGRRREAAHAERLETLKAEVRREMGQAANEILELEDRVRISENERAQELYAAGAKGYAEFQEELEAASSFEEIHHLGNKIDQVLWQLEAAEALIEGREVPPQPTPEPLPTPEPQARPERRADLPPELDLRRDRRGRIESDARSRGGGFGSLGGLGTIAVILREMQRAGQAGRRPSRSRLGGGRRSGGGVRMPRFPGFGTGGGRRPSSPGPRRRTASPSRRSTPRASRPKGRGRRRR